MTYTVDWTKVPAKLKLVVFYTVVCAGCKRVMIDRETIKVSYGICQECKTSLLKGKGN